MKYLVLLGGPPCFLHIWVVLFSSTLSFGVLILLVPSPWVMNFLHSAQLASPSIGVSCSPLSLALPATLTQSLPSPPGLFSHYPYCLSESTLESKF